MAGRSFDGAGRFPTTNWSLVGHAGDEGDESRSVALGELLRTYWPALKAHLVYRRRFDPHDADDLVQGFIENKVLERNLVGLAEQSRGRFRSFLVASLDNFVASQIQRRQTKKRAADRAVPIDPQDGQQWSAAQVRPDQAFDVQWARQVLRQAAESMREECQQSQRDDLWGLFEARVLAPCRDGEQPLGYELLVQRFGFQSPSQASNALITAKRMFARRLRDVVRQYATDEEDVDAEIQELQRCLSGQ